MNTELPNSPSTGNREMLDWSKARQIVRDVLKRIVSWTTCSCPVTSFLEKVVKNLFITSIVRNIGA